jgi:hypothetical protein
MWPLVELANFGLYSSLADNIVLVVTAHIVVRGGAWIEWDLVGSYPCLKILLLLWR